MGCFICLCLILTKTPVITSNSVCLCAPHCSITRVLSHPPCVLFSGLSHILNFSLIYIFVFSASVFCLLKINKKTFPVWLPGRHLLIKICESFFNSLVKWVHSQLLFSPHKVHTFFSTALIMLSYSNSYVFVCLLPDPHEALDLSNGILFS